MKHSLDFYDYLLLCLRVLPKDFGSLNLDYGARSILAFLAAKGMSTETLKYLQGGFLLKGRSVNLDFGRRTWAKPVCSRERGG